MKRKDRLLAFLLKPPLWVCIAVWCLGAAFTAGSIVAYYFGAGGEDWAVPIHIGTAVGAVLSVYAALTVTGVPERAKDSPKVMSFVKSYTVRTYVYGACAIIFNACYVAFGIVIAYLQRSAWLGALVGYHVFLLLPRIEVIITSRVAGKRKDEKNAAVNHLRAYANCGLMLILLSAAIVPVIRMTLRDANTYRHFVSATVYVVSIATYSFVKMGIAVYNFKKVRKQDDLAPIALKNVSFADALISMFALQAMMLKELDTGFSPLAYILNPLVGGLTAAAIFAFGLHMMIGGHKKLRALENSPPVVPNEDEAVEGKTAAGENNITSDNAANECYEDEAAAGDSDAGESDMGDSDAGESVEGESVEGESDMGDSDAEKAEISAGEGTFGGE